MATPLEGFRVIDVSRAGPGRWATGQLADYGADVISIVEPGYVERIVSSGEVSEKFAALNQRNKRSILLNLRSEEGRAVLMDIVKVADGFLESNRPGVTKRLGIDYDSLRLVNPSIVYCSLSGFGQYGPYANVGAHDLSYQAIAGLLPLDQSGRPQITAYNYADMIAAWHAVIAILVALVERSRSGEGQYIDVSFCDVCVRIPPGGPREPGIRGEYASYNIYETSDGEYLAFSTRDASYWDRLCLLLGRPDWKPHIRPKDEAMRVEQLSFFGSFFKTKTRAEWVNILHQHDLQFGPVNRTVEQLRDDPQLRAREMVLESIHPITGETSYDPGFPLKFSRTPLTLRREPSRLGCDTEVIMRELGYDDAKIGALREAKAIG